MEAFFNETTCFIYLAAAFVLIVAEAFIPSFGTLSILAAVFAVGAVTSGFYADTTLGFVVLGVVIVVFPLLVVALFRNLDRLPVGKRLIPPEPEVPRMRELEELCTLEGKEGVSLTPLMPSGIVKVAGKRIDALTEGEFIERNTAVRVVRVEGTRVFVRKKE